MDEKYKFVNIICTSKRTKLNVTARIISYLIYKEWILLSLKEKETAVHILLLSYINLKYISEEKKYQKTNKYVEEQFIDELMYKILFIFCYILIVIAQKNKE